MTATLQKAGRLYGAGDLPAAARVCLDILRSEPHHFDALHLLGVICTNSGYRADGVSYLLRATASRPDDVQVQINLGHALGSVQRFEEALAAYRSAGARVSQEPALLNSIGLTLRGLRRTDEAIGCFRAALTRDPAHHPARFNLGRALRDAGHTVEAEAQFLWLLGHLPPDTPASRRADTVNELAQTYIDAERPAEAVAILRQEIERGTAADTPRWNESLALLVMGRFQEGWPAYEDRWRAPNGGARDPDSIVLDLDRVAGQRVLVKEEQGRGDNIQFMRYVRLLAARGARVFLSTYADLTCLAQEMPDVELVVSPENPDCEYDMKTSIMSLPLAFRTDFDTIPAEVPYLRTPADRIARMRRHLGPRREPRVGVVWSGSVHSRGRAAVPVRTLEPLLRRPGVEFHCLQKELDAGDRVWLAETGLAAIHDTAISDFGDTAALIDAMDLVVSIDTAVAHLAGALAKPVWIMLARNPDWRWLLDRDDSPWYPTARLFRQPSRGDWDGVVRAVVAALAFGG